MTPFRAGVLALVVIGLFTYFALHQAEPVRQPVRAARGVRHRPTGWPSARPCASPAWTWARSRRSSRWRTAPGMARVTMEIDDAGLPIKQRRGAEGPLAAVPRGQLLRGPAARARPTRRSSTRGATIPPEPDGRRRCSSARCSPRSSRRRARTSSALLQRVLERAASGAGRARLQPGDQALGGRLPEHLAGERRARSASERARPERGCSTARRACSARCRANEDALKDLVTDLNDTIAALRPPGGQPARRDPRAARRAPRGPARAGVAQPRAARDPRASRATRCRARAPRTATLDAQLPFIRQARGLMSERELRGLARELRAAVPYLARLNQAHAAHARAEPRARLAARTTCCCRSRKTPIPDPDFDWHTGEPWFEESPRAFVGLSGESRIADANSPILPRAGRRRAHHDRLDRRDEDEPAVRPARCAARRRAPGAARPSGRCSARTCPARRRSRRT